MRLEQRDSMSASRCEQERALRATHGGRPTAWLKAMAARLAWPQKVLA
jgi:hypothetical protein